MEGTSYGNYLDFDDCSTTSQSGFTLFIGRWWLGMVDWYEHLSVVGHRYGGGDNDYDNKDRRMMQMISSDEQDDIILYNCYECYTNFHYFIFRLIDPLQV
jgi:hypothetical protein